MLGALRRITPVLRHEKAALFQNLVQSAAELLPSPPTYPGGLEVTPTTEEVNAFRQKNAKEIEILLRTLGAPGVQRIILEGGHIYAGEEFDDKYLLDLVNTGLLGAVLKNDGYDVTSMLMVDDYHATAEQRDTFDIDACLSLAAYAGWHVEHVYKENDLVSGAEAILKELTDRGQVIPEDSGMLMKGSRVELITRKTGDWSCALLDAALTVSKFSNLDGDGIITVLPRSLRGQQENMRRIVRTFVGTSEAGTMYNFFLDGAGSAKTGSHYSHR